MLPYALAIVAVTPGAAIPSCLMLDMSGHSAVLRGVVKTDVTLTVNTAHPHFPSISERMHDIHDAPLLIQPQHLDLG